MTKDYAERARALVGMPFRPQGRGPHGLDCAGVAIATFDIPASGVRGDYPVRGVPESEARAAVSNYFRRIPATQARAGDLLLMRVADDQVHLGVKTDAGFVHAHAGLRKVVETPGEPGWPVISVYRRRSR